MEDCVGADKDSPTISNWVGYNKGEHQACLMLISLMLSRRSSCTRLILFSSSSKCNTEDSRDRVERGPPLGFGMVSIQSSSTTQNDEDELTSWGHLPRSDLPCVKWHVSAVPPRQQSAS